MPRGGRRIKRKSGGVTMKASAMASGRGGQRLHKKNCMCNQCCPPPPNVSGAKVLGEAEILDNSKTIRCFTDYMYMLNNRHMRRTQGKQQNIAKSIEELLADFNRHVSIVSEMDTDKSECIHLAQQFIQKGMYSTSTGKIEVDGTLGNFSNGFLGSQWVDIKANKGNGPDIRRWAFYTKWNVPTSMSGSLNVKNDRDTTFYFVDMGIVGADGFREKMTTVESTISEAEEILGSLYADMPSGRYNEWEL